MKPMLDWMLANRGKVRLIVVVAALLLGYGVAEIYRINLEADYHRVLEGQAQREAASLRAHTLGSKAMGAVSLAGQIDPQLQAAAGSIGTDTRNAAAASAVLELLARSVDGDGAFVANDEGLITASWDNKGRSRTGNSVKFRPYFQMAMERIESVYAAVGSSTGDRALYIAAPVFDTAGNSGNVRGAVVARIDMRDVDRVLSTVRGIALLQSPQGVVFASNRTEWLFALSGDIDAERVRKIASLKQFGKDFETGGTPRALPIDPARREVVVDGKRYGVSRSTLNWNDPNGDWSIIVLGDLDAVVPAEWRTGIAAIVALGIFALLFVVFRALRDGRARHEAVAVTKAAAEQLAAEAELKSRQANFGASLQLAQTLSDLAQILFRELSGFIPLHQGSLYFSTPGNTLRLAGTYGTDGAPAEIAFGDGLPGQCAIERQPIRLANPPEGFWHVRSALGGDVPRTLLVVPILRNANLLGVLELASLDAGFDAQQQVIDSLLPVVAMNLEILLGAERIRLALHDAREQAAGLQALKESREKTELWLQTVIDAAPDGMLVVDDNGLVTLSNQAAERMFGYDKGQFNGMPVERLLPPQLRGKHAEQRKGFALAEDHSVLMATNRTTLTALTSKGNEFQLSISLARLPAIGAHGPSTCAVIRSEHEA